MLLAIVAFYVSFTDYKIFIVCYALSEILDAVDGHAARAFGQGALTCVYKCSREYLTLFVFRKASRFGAVLDMVTDRCTFTVASLCVATYFLYLSVSFIGVPRPACWWYWRISIRA